MTKQQASRGKSGMGGGKKKSKSGKHVHEMYIKRGKSGGFIATHHFDNSGSGPDEPPEMPEDHVIPDAATLGQHVQDQMGDQGAAPMAPPPDAQAGPGPGGPQAGM